MASYLPSFDFILKIDSFEQQIEAYDKLIDQYKEAADMNISNEAYRNCFYRYIEELTRLKEEAKTKQRNKQMSSEKDGVPAPVKAPQTSRQGRSFLQAPQSSRRVDSSSNWPARYGIDTTMMSPNSLTNFRKGVQELKNEEKGYRDALENVAMASLASIEASANRNAGYADIYLSSFRNLSIARDSSSSPSLGTSNQRPVMNSVPISNNRSNPISNHSNPISSSFGTSNQRSNPIPPLAGAGNAENQRPSGPMNSKPAENQAPNSKPFISATYRPASKPRSVTWKKCPAPTPGIFIWKKRKVGPTP